MRVSRCAVVKSQAATCCLCFTEEAENFWKIFFFFLQSTWPPPVYVTDKSAACHLPLAALSILVSMHTWTKHAFRPFWTTKSDKALTVGSRSSKTLNFLPNKAARSSADDGPIPHFLGGEDGPKGAFTGHTGEIRVSLYAASLFIPPQILRLCTQTVEETLLLLSSIIGKTPQLRQTE